MNRLREPGDTAPFRSLGDVLRAWVRRAPEPRRAAAIWALVAGPRISSRSRVRRAEEGRVEVLVSDEMWRDTLRGMSGELLRRMNRVAGESGRYRELQIEVD